MSQSVATPKIELFASAVTMAPAWSAATLPARLASPGRPRRIGVLDLYATHQRQIAVRRGIALSLPK